MSVQIPRTDAETEAGTKGEVQLLPPWSDQHQFRSIVLVTTKDHSRQFRRVSRSSNERPSDTCHGTTDTLLELSTRTRWWKTRGGVRTEIGELPEARARRRAAPTVVLTLSIPLPGSRPRRGAAGADPRVLTARQRPQGGQLCPNAVCRREGGEGCHAVPSHPNRR